MLIFLVLINEMTAVNMRSQVKVDWNPLYYKYIWSFTYTETISIQVKIKNL